MPRTQKGLLQSISQSNRIKANDYLIEIIINALNGQKKFGNNPSSFGYLMAQTIRQYIIPNKNWHLSNAAYNLWNSITNEDIKRYHYRQVIHCSLANGSQNAIFYSGASGSGVKKAILNNDRIVYNSVFISEHVIPINEIITQIMQLSIVNKQSIRNILDTMHVCRMLKEEDRRIINKSKRGKNFSHIVSTIYNSAGITLKY